MGVKTEEILQDVLAHPKDVTFKGHEGLTVDVRKVIAKYGCSNGTGYLVKYRSEAKLRSKEASS